MANVIFFLSKNVKNKELCNWIFLISEVHLDYKYEVSIPERMIL